MFKLSLDLEPETGPMITIPSINVEETPRKIKKELTFLNSLPKELQKVVGEIRGKAKGKKCPKLKSDASGAFGTIEISQNKVKKLLGLIQKKDEGTLLRSYGHLKKDSQLYFLINRLNNYCKDIRTFVTTVRKIFPNNFLKIYKCNLCQGPKGKKATPNVYVEMALGKGKTLKEVLQKKTISKKELESVFIQIYYISMVLNMKKLYHNDLKPANIIIAKSEHSIIYDSLKNSGEFIKMKLPKGSYYPIFIDYDLISRNKAETVEGPGFISPGSPDFSFFATTTSKVDRNQEKVLDKLPEFDSSAEIKKGIKEMYDAMKKLNNILTIKYTTQKGGGKKKKGSLKGILKDTGYSPPKPKPKPKYKLSLSQMIQQDMLEKQKYKLKQKKAREPKKLSLAQKVKKLFSKKKVKTPERKVTFDVIRKIHKIPAIQCPKNRRARLKSVNLTQKEMKEDLFHTGIIQGRTRKRKQVKKCPMGFPYKDDNDCCHKTKQNKK